jgi:hypothetical protein
MESYSRILAFRESTNVANGVKWDKTREKLLVTNEPGSVIGLGERILCEFGAKMADNWVERRRWHLHGLPGTESEYLSLITYTSRVYIT